MMSVWKRGVRWLCKVGFFNWLPDRPYIKMLYRIRMDAPLHLDPPKTYNEKLQWIKLYDRKPIYTEMVDKYSAKKYAASLIGEQYIIPTLGVWDSPEQIDFSELPQKFVLKTTHDSGGVKIIDQRECCDRRKIDRFFHKRLKRSLYKITREWPYKNVKPRILAEPYVVDESTRELRDYKIFTFNGKPKAFFIAQNRGKDTRMDYFDIERNHLPLTWGYPRADKLPDLPVNLNLMIELAEKLAVNTYELRVDFYEANGKVYFGELTLFDGSGFSPIEPKEWDRKLGDWIHLPI